MTTTNAETFTMAAPIISYADAKARGLKRYFTGRPCKRGHIAERFVSHCGCIECAYARTDAWGKTAGGNETKNRISREWHASNPGYSAQWMKENPDARRRTARKWYVGNAEQAVRASLNWAKNNPEKSRTRYRNRLARKKGAAGSHTAAQILMLLDLQDWKCRACGTCIRDKRHIDHILPLVLGGSNYIWNLQGLCPTCNCSKSAKHPLIWERERSEVSGCA